MVDIAMAYGAMFMAQTRGPAIIGGLWGDAARRAAETGNDDVSPNAPLETLCRAYEAHHFDDASDMLHAAGMVLAPLALLRALTSKGYAKRARYLAWVPPTWYLYAWAGHFFIQKDIPAVFSYGMSLRGWAVGEYCSLRALYGWGPSGFKTIPDPWQAGVTLAIVVLHFLICGKSVVPWGEAAASESAGLARPNLKAA